MRCRVLVLMSIAFLVISGSGTTSWGQEIKPPQPLPVDPELARLPISSMLYHLEGKIEGHKATGQEFVELAEALGFHGLESGLVNVEIVNLNGDIPANEAFIKSVGGEMDAVWRGQTSAYIPPSQAARLADSLPSGYYLRHANLAMGNNEGPATMGSDTYVSPGPAGLGMTVGIIDRGFFLLDAAEIAGVVPIATRHNYNTDSDFISGTNQHGTAHLETVFDHVPDAEFHLFRINSSTHLGLAVDAALSLGVNVLSATQSFYNEGWPDNSGAAAQAAYHAATNGILYVSSSGNRGKDHWQGSFNDSVFLGWLDWSGGDAYNDLGTINDDENVRLYMQWDRYSGGPNYDLYLFDDSGNILDSSTSGGTGFEQINWTNETGGPVDASVGVYHVSGIRVELEVFENISGNTFQYRVPESSLTSPNNNSAANCLVIGAVPFSNYTDGNLEDYSSRGPTNSGAIGVDLVGPTNTTTFAYGTTPYSGTSCSTPNVAGASAALWASRPELSATGVRYILTHLADLYNDWGDSGPDPQYGYGGLQLPVYQDMTQWIDRWAFNGAGTPELPWYYVSDALIGSLDGSRLLFLGGSYPEPVTLGFPRTLESVVESAVLGADQ